VAVGLGAAGVVLTETVGSGAAVVVLVAGVGTAVAVLVAGAVASVSEEPTITAAPVRLPITLESHVLAAVVHPVRRLATSET